MSKNWYAGYRGQVRALAPVGNVLAFVSVHPEGQPTPVYRLRPEREPPKWESNKLPAGGVALFATPDALWIVGTDGQVYRQAIAAKEKDWADPKAHGPRFDPVPVALAPLAGERLAVATGNEVAILSREDGKVQQRLMLPDAATCLAADPTGQWLAAGTGKGNISIFECETDFSEYRLSDSAPLHEAAVTALLFEADELRLLSAGADQKLLSTHARGKLEPEDRGRGAVHDEPITAMVAISADRFLTGSSDGSIKSWPRAKGARPVTQKDDVPKVVALAVMPVHDRPHAVVAGQDNTLRFFRLDAEGKFEEYALNFGDAVAWATNTLKTGTPGEREKKLRELKDWGDTVSVELIAERMHADDDHRLRLLSSQLLGEITHPRAAKLLEKGLDHNDEAVRVAAFEGLRKKAGPNDLRPLVLALKAEKANVGLLAVEALQGLAKKDDQALAQLVEAINAQTPEVRKAALEALEKVHPAKSPEASLTGLTSQHADLRRLALVRLFQRKLLHDARVEAALRWRGEDSDAEVRRVAFLLSLYTRDKLVQALRQGDPELDRQLVELETGGTAKTDGERGA
jgi:ParB family chromosome partitioning protein